MFDKYLKPENLDPETIAKAYTYLKEYCDEHDTTVNKLLSDTGNIGPAAVYIHSKLPFAIRMVLSKDKIEKLITEHFDFIKTEADKMAKQK